MRTANNANTGRSNLKDTALSVPVFCAFFLKKGLLKSKKHKERMVRGAPRNLNKEVQITNIKF